jgi:3-phenylpropionate/trans-cinnamate dioxygenase ferredoxin subunit
LPGRALNLGKKIKPLVKERPMPEITIKVRENASYWIPGRVRYVDAEGQEHVTEGKVVSLCRCGGSATKPFCDGTHRKNGFEGGGMELVLIEQPGS